jgi:hypothetical protein
LFLIFSAFVFSQNLQDHKFLIDHIKACIQKAEDGHSKLDNNILNLEGMSGNKFRHFINNLCSLPGASYLEVGCWKGSTFVSALKGNESILKNVLAIDNWSQFGGPKNQFFSNIQANLKNPNYEFLDVDSFNFEIEKVKKKFGVYFYDGDHSKIAQEKAFTYLNPLLEDVFIAVVDDFNWQQVREGTFEAFKKMNYKVLYEKMIFTPFQDRNTWWNGVYIGLIQKGAE